MFDPAIRREIFERLTDAPVETRIEASAQPAEEDIGPEAYQGFWEAWVTLTTTMVLMGFTHRSLCDAAGEVVAAKEEIVAHRERV